jgi:hypothetical protein
MKRNNQIYRNTFRIFAAQLLLSGLIFIPSSCVRTEEDLFEESAALRLNRAVSETKNMLLSADNGWVMEYFPTSSQPGVTFLIKFEGDEMATVAAKNEFTPEYTESQGAWNVIDDTGPVLTFDSYIDVLHLFSDPNNELGDGAGVGLAGDYEFIILNASEETFTLKGKKRGTDIRLHRLADGQRWEDYFTALENMDARLFSKGAVLNVTVNDQILYSLENGYSHIFTIVPTDSAADSEDVPFIITADGIRLSKTWETENLSVQAFKLSEDKSYLYAVENQSIRITNSTTPLSFFLSENNWTQGIVWTIDGLNSDGAFQTAYANVIEGCKTVYKEDFVGFFFTRKSGGKTLSFKSGMQTVGMNKGKPYEGAFDFDISNTEKEGEVVFVDKGKADTNANIYKSKIDGFGEILDLITNGGPFTVTTDNPLSLSVLKFESVSNPDNRFVLSLSY